MNWIKQHPAQLSLAATACGAIAATTALYFSTVAFPKTFLAHRSDSLLETPAATIDVAPLDHAIAAVNAPDTWNEDDRGRLFAGKAYIKSGDRLVTPEILTLDGNVPYIWVKKFGLDPYGPAVLSEDPDRDGFTTRQEWLGMDAVAHSENVTKS